MQHPYFPDFNIKPYRGDIVNVLFNDFKNWNADDIGSKYRFTRINNEIRVNQRCLHPYYLRSETIRIVTIL